MHSRFATSLPEITEIPFGNSVIALKQEVHNLGVLLDYILTGAPQINNCCQSAFLALSHTSKIRKYLEQPTAEKLIHGFITYRLDYCNSLLSSIPENQIKKLQRIPKGRDSRLCAWANCHVSPFNSIVIETIKSTDTGSGNNPIVIDYSLELLL